ncbi:WD repeat protein 35, partial [Aphelenchoides avenae]
CQGRASEASATSAAQEALRHGRPARGAVPRAEQGSVGEGTRREREQRHNRPPGPAQRGAYADNGGDEADRHRLEGRRGVPLLHARASAALS